MIEFRDVVKIRKIENITHNSYLILPVIIKGCPAKRAYNSPDTALVIIVSGTPICPLVSPPIQNEN